MIALALLLTLSQGADAEVFVDREVVYLREGSRAGVKPGDVVELLDAKDNLVGKARVGEVYEALAKLEVAPAAAAKVAKGRFGVISQPPLVGAEGQVAAQAPAGTEAHAQPGSGDELAAPSAAGPRALVGAASVAGVGPLKRIKVYNRSKVDWHGCDVRLPNNRHYRLGNLQADSSEGILWFRFEADGVERDLPLDSVAVKCTEGAARFVFEM